MQLPPIEKLSQNNKVTEFRLTYFDHFSFLLYFQFQPLTELLENNCTSIQTISQWVSYFLINNMLEFMDE